MKLRNWLLDGGVSRFAVVVIVGLLVSGVTVLSVVAYHFFALKRGVEARTVPASTAGASLAPGHDDEDGAIRPDPLSAARWGVSRWLNGDPGAWTPEGLSGAPTGLTGALVADGGEALVNGDSYSAVSVPMTIENAPARATVELSWGNEQWQIISMVLD